MEVSSSSSVSTNSHEHSTAIGVVESPPVQVAPSFTAFAGGVAAAPASGFWSRIVELQALLASSEQARVAQDGELVRLRELSGITGDRTFVIGASASHPAPPPPGRLHDRAKDKKQNQRAKLEMASLDAVDTDIPPSSPGSSRLQKVQATSEPQVAAASELRPLPTVPGGKSAGVLVTPSTLAEDGQGEHQAVPLSSLDEPQTAAPSDASGAGLRAQDSAAWHSIPIISDSEHAASPDDRDGARIRDGAVWQWLSAAERETLPRDSDIDHATIDSSVSVAASRLDGHRGVMASDSDTDMERRGQRDDLETYTSVFSIHRSHAAAANVKAQAGSRHRPLPSLPQAAASGKNDLRLEGEWLTKDSQDAVDAHAGGNIDMSAGPSSYRIGASAQSPTTGRWPVDVHVQQGGSSSDPDLEVAALRERIMGVKALLSTDANRASQQSRSVLDDTRVHRRNILIGHNILPRPIAQSQLHSTGMRGAQVNRSRTRPLPDFTTAPSSPTSSASGFPAIPQGSGSDSPGRSRNRSRDRSAVSPPHYRTAVLARRNRLRELAHTLRDARALTGAPFEEYLDGYHSIHPPVPLHDTRAFLTSSIHRPASFSTQRASDWPAPGVGREDISSSPSRGTKFHPLSPATAPQAGGNDSDSITSGIVHVGSSADASQHPLVPLSPHTAFSPQAQHMYTRLGSAHSDSASGMWSQPAEPLPAVGKPHHAHQHRTYTTSNAARVSDGRAAAAHSSPDAPAGYSGYTHLSRTRQPETEVGSLNATRAADGSGHVPAHWLMDVMGQYRELQLLYDHYYSEHARNILTGNVSYTRSTPMAKGSFTPHTKVAFLPSAEEREAIAAIRLPEREAIAAIRLPTYCGLGHSVTAGLESELKWLAQSRASATLQTLLPSQHAASVAAYDLPVGARMGSSGEHSGSTVSRASPASAVHIHCYT